MAELPILPLRTADILADTTHMTLEEFGAYCRLLFVMWGRGGRVRDDASELARMVGTTTRKWSKIEKVLRRELTISGGEISQKRLTDTFLKVRELRAKRAAVANHGWEKRRMQMHMQKQCNSNATKTKTSNITSFLEESVRKKAWKPEE